MYRTIISRKKSSSILDFDDIKSFEQVVEKLGKLNYYNEINVKGNNLYSTTISWYQRFLNAKNLFSQHKEVIPNIKKRPISSKSTMVPLKQASLIV